MADDAIILHVTSGPRAGERIAIDRPLIVGRGSVDVVIDDEEISRRHLRLRPTDEGLEVEDLGSTNGTQIDGRRVDGVGHAADGSVIAFGSTSARVELPGAATTVHEAAGGIDEAAGRTEIRPRAAAGAEIGAAADGPETSAGGTAREARSGGAAPPLEPLPASVARASMPLSTSPRGDRKRIAGALVLLVVGGAIGAAIALAANSSSSSAKSASGTSALSEGSLSTTSTTCVGDGNGRPGPGHFRFITSACENAARTIATFPLHRGVSGGKTVYYVITDDSNRAEAAAKGVNFVPKLANAIGSPGVQKVTVSNGIVSFPATVDFNHKRVLVPSPTGAFPPTTAEPPALADPGYSPLIELPNGIVENAPQVINSTGRAAKVLAVDLAKMTVSYRETEGRYEGKHVHYASFDAGSPIAATLEDVDYAPLLDKVPKEGDTGLHTSARETLIAVINGPINTSTFPLDPERQGENDVALGEGDPRNMLEEAPVLPDHVDVGDETYAPMWDVHFAEWTTRAVQGGDRRELLSTEEVELRLSRGATACEQGEEACKQGLITGPEGKPFGPAGFVVNCPLISIDLP